MTNVPKPDSRGPGRPRGERLLSGEQIVETALALLDTHGPAGLSMRRIADALGVHNNALYTYVADRAALEAAIVERLLSEADPALLEGPPRRWRSRVTGFARSLRAVLRAHPGAMGLFITAPMTGPVALHVGEGLLRCLADAGLPPQRASRGAYTIIVYVLGFLALDIAETDARPPLPNDDERRRQRQVRFEHIDTEQYPLSAATTTTMAAWVSVGVFEWGLHALLDGIVPPTPA